MTDTDCPLGF